MFTDKTPIWDLHKPRERRRSFPYRIKIARITDLRESDFESLVNKLSFIENKRKWGSYPQQGMRKLSLEDAKVIVNALM